MAGFWNRMIFAPEWVGEHVFHAAEFEKFVLMAPASPLLYRHDSISLTVAEDKMIFGLARPSRESLLRAEAMCVQVLDILAYTPLIAVGLNFGFTENEPNNALLELFNSPDYARLLERDWSSENRTIVRVLKRGTLTLNLQLSLEGNGVRVEANFDVQVARGPAAVDVIRNHSAERLDTLLNLLSDIYGLQLQEEHQ